MPNFCGKCGTRLDDATGLCPKCNANTMNGTWKPDNNHNRTVQPNVQPPKRDYNKQGGYRQRKPDNWSGVSLGKRIKRFILKFILIVLLLFIVSAGGLGALVYFDIVDAPVVEDILGRIGIKKIKKEEPKPEEVVINPDDYKVEPEDAKKYFEENSQIMSEVDANQSKDVLTEKQVIALLKERGFTDPVTTSYAMDGTYNEETEVNDSSSVKHPAYQTFYVNKNEEVWAIAVIDGDIMANPLSYNMEAASDAQVTVAESDTVTSYDSATNKFFKTVPNGDVMNVIVVERIDAATLNELTVEAIGD